MKGGGLGRYNSIDHYKCECGEGFRNRENYRKHRKKCENVSVSKI